MHCYLLGMSFSYKCGFGALEMGSLLMSIVCGLALLSFETHLLPVDFLFQGRGSFVI